MQWLMDEPLTLFDSGLYQIRKDVEKTNSKLEKGGYPFPDGFRSHYGWVDYEWKTDKIVIGFLVSAPSQEEKNIRSCKALWHNLRETVFELGGLTGSDEKLRRIEERIETYFSHSGFKRDNTPKGIGHSIAQRVNLKVKFGMNDDRLTLICEAPVLGGDFVYGGGALSK